MACVALVGAAIFAIHKFPYVLMRLEPRPKGMHYCLFSVKGDTGYTIDLATYARQIRCVHDAGATLFRPDPYHCENAGKTFPDGNLVYALCTAPMALTDNVELAFAASSFFGILACTLLLWHAARLQCRPGTSGAAMWAAFLLSMAILFLCGGWPLDVLGKLQVAFGRVPLPRDLGYVGRFPHIEFSLLILVAWWTALVKVSVDGKATSAALLGLALAAAQFSYFYFWTACAMATFFALVVFSRPKNPLRVCLVAAGVYLPLALPMLLRTFAFERSMLGRDYLVRAGTELGRQPTRISLWYIAVALLLFGIDIAHTKLVEKTQGFFAAATAAIKKSSLQLSMLAAYAVCMNMQLILGKTLQPYHWTSAFYLPMIGILVFPYLVRVYEAAEAAFSTRLARGLVAATFAALALVVAASIGSQIRFAQAWSRFFALSGDEQAIVNFIRSERLAGPLWSNNTNMNLVVGANTPVPLLFGAGICAYNTDRECMERLVYGFWRMGYSADQVLAELRKGQRWVDCLRDLRQGKGDPFFLDASCAMDNYAILNLLGHRTYLSSDRDGPAYEVSADLASKVRSLHGVFSREGRAPFRVDYLLYDKRILPAGLHPGGRGQDKILLENNTFLLTRAISFEKAAASDGAGAGGR